MDAAGNHHSQQTITRTENQTPHVLTHRWELNNEITWTREGEHHTPGPIMGRGKGGGIALGVIPDVNDELMRADELMDAAGNHNSQQTIARTENQTPHVLTHRWELNNQITWTLEGEHHTLGPIMGRGGRDCTGSYT